MIPESLRMKGYIGIKKGLGLDEIFIDFTKFPPGLISISGHNGCGKSTLLGGMHLFRCDPYRPEDALHDLVIDKGEKEFICSINGTRYRSLIIMDRIKRKQEAYLYKPNGKDWVPVGDARGKLGPYDAEVEKLLGSKRLYFLSGFRAQDAEKLSEKKTGQLKEIFEDLLGYLKIIKEYSDKAKKVKEALLRKREDLQLKINLLNDDIEQVATSKTEKIEVESNIKTTADELKKAEDSIKSLNKEIKDVEVNIQAQKSLVESVNKLKLDKEQKEGNVISFKESINEITDDYDSKLKGKNEKLERARKFIDNADKIRAGVEEEKKLTGQFSELEKEKNATEATLKEIREKVQYFNELGIKKSEKIRAIESAEKNREHETTSAAEEIERIKSGNEKLNIIPCKETDYPQTCPYVGDVKDVLPKLTELKAKLEELRKPDLEIENLRLGLEQFEDALKDKLKTDEALKDSEADLEECEGKIRLKETAIDEANKFAKCLSELELSEGTLKEVKTEIEALEKDKEKSLSKIKEEIAGLEVEITTMKGEIFTKEMDIKTDLQEKLNDLDHDKCNQETVVNLSSNSLQKLHIELGTLQATDKKAAEAAGKIKKVEKEVDELDKEIAEWTQLQIACGRERGIIPMEIDDAGPQVSAIANDLLKKCFGPRFIMKIITTEPTKDGKSTKETFDIMVIDGDYNEIMSINKLSGGEKIWINDGLCKAICLYNKNNAIETMLLDETDGPLDGQMKKAYMNMNRSFLEVGGFHRIFFISHDPASCAMADSQIILGGKDKPVELVA